MITCNICGIQLNQARKPDTLDCGGDCLRCMAEFDDPECVEVMQELEPDNPKWKTDDAT